MSGFVPKVPIALQIRKIIFEKFNDIDGRFTNDEIFDILKQNGDVDSSWIVDDIEPFINEICDMRPPPNFPAPTMPTRMGFPSAARCASC